MKLDLSQCSLRPPQGADAARQCDVTIDTRCGEILTSLSIISVSPFKNKLLYILEHVSTPLRLSFDLRLPRACGQRAAGETADFFFN